MNHRNPFRKLTVADLVEYLNDEDYANGNCEATPIGIYTFADRNGLDKDKLSRFLREHKPKDTGFCDCTIAYMTGPKLKLDLPK